MNYVLDSSVAFKWPIVETDTDKARRLRDAYRHGIHELLSPDILPIELGHALTRAERQGRIVPPEAARFWADVKMERGRGVFPGGAPMTIPSRRAAWRCVCLA